MKRKGPAPDLVLRLADSDWERWEFNGHGPRLLPADAAVEGAVRTLAVPARHVVATPIWIEGADPALAPEAAKLELEVRGLLPRAQGMQGVALRLIPAETRTLAVAAVFPPELPEACPPADRFETSPFLRELPADSVTLWREGEDYVAAFTRGRDVVYWETIDRSVSAAEVRVWLGVIVQRLLAEGVLATPPELVCAVEGLPVDRILPPACRAVTAPPPPATPSLTGLRGDWQPVSAQEAAARRLQRERMRNVVLAVAAGYLVLAAVLLLYAGSLRWKAARLAAENTRLAAAVETFQPIRKDWSLLAPTVEPAQFPLELLRGAVEAMPTGNIHLTRFVVEDGRIIIEGEADSFALASDYYNALAASEPLKGIDWSGNTNPSVGPTVTTFHAEGSLPTP